MDGRPNLIAPVIIVACTLIVVGGIGTALSGSEDSSATVASTENGVAVPTTGTLPAATSGIATTGTGAGGAATNMTTPDVNATVPTLTATAGADTATAIRAESGQGSARLSGSSPSPCTRAAGYP